MSIFLACIVILCQNHDCQKWMIVNMVQPSTVKLCNRISVILLSKNPPSKECVGWSQCGQLSTVDRRRLDSKQLRFWWQYKRTNFDLWVNRQAQHRTNPIKPQSLSIHRSLSSYSTNGRKLRPDCMLSESIQLQFLFPLFDTWLH